jgi:hypothetical protein
MRNIEQLKCKNWNWVRTTKELQINHQDYKNPEFVEIKYIRYATCVDNKPKIIFLIKNLRYHLAWIID